MAFISEIYHRPQQGGPQRPSVEVRLAPSDMARKDDFSIASYHRDGSLARHVAVTDQAAQVDPLTGWSHVRLPLHVSASGHDGPPAVAMIDRMAHPKVTTFYDIAGDGRHVTATTGPAEGATSQHVPISDGPAILFDARGNRMDGQAAPERAVICLTEGSLIDTPNGPVAIEELQVGDDVTTLDNGDQPIRMIYRRTFDGPSFRMDRDLWPVCIQAGALGFGLPRRNLWVSPQHRMLFRHIRIPLMFGEDAVFVRAKSLAAGFDEVYVDSGRKSVTYFHLVFDRHEVIYAEGSPTESFHTGARGIAALDPEARTELFRIFPELRVETHEKKMDYLTLRSWELLAMVS